MSHRTKGWLLICLFVTWAGLLAIRVGTYEEPLTAPLTYRSGQALVKTENPAAILPAVAKASSREETLTLRPPKNIFAPLSRRIDIAEAQDPQDIAAQAERSTRKGNRAERDGRSALSPQQAAIELARAQREQAAMQARQRMAQYRFIGYLSQNGEPRAFLGKGTDLYIVRAGETLEGQIRVAAIEATSLRLRDAASDTESALSLTKGGQPGEPPPTRAGVEPAVEPEHP